ncbi:conserved hypothetical protein [Beutenbergia cavernae DSM 12333]|uniref:Uncharacterized protein n=1 Tax=Beutenbergia cavernae (strain ATCC BAA-8 / DSM 12333 / CCUG 43141 / JCM 11478 / NBRC 16432 / NCIMB 13614 / HKI 0122) TaxID=471853 RepID=C5BWD7_BEUC1|nr:hypothetical protein [Beutenbergia cavernae]ACQ78595.1 conserved hypothetical protein [Beutenbergia cavernae DSM 12333]
MSDDAPIDIMPMLAKGKHRSPRKGACFMELASYLAGEAWSDHPACTHRLLASMARLVNDLTNDAARPRLAPLIPSVIGLTSADLRWDAGIALRAATTALPIAAAERQNTLAVGIIAAERALAVLDGHPVDELTPRGRAALARAPRAAAWAVDFCAGAPVRPERFGDRAAAAIISSSVQGIAEAAVPDSDDRLYDLLDETIAECRRWADLEERARQELTPDMWAAVCKPAVLAG